MAQDAGRMILMLGVLGVGGYIAYEYTQYQTGLSNLNHADPSGATAAAIQANLSFMSWLTLKLGMGSPSGNAEANAFTALQNAIAGVVTMPPTPTPGTTPTMSAGGQSTSVSTTPTTTPTTGGTTTASSAATVSQPTAADLQHAINKTLANADQWNYGYKQLLGTGIESVYGFNFDQVYGAVQGREQIRSSGMMTAQAFLSAPVNAGFKPTAGFSGLGAIAHFYTPITRSVGSMLYSAQHPSPYRQPSYNLAGFVQPLGFEMALLGRQTLRSNRII